MKAETVSKRYLNRGATMGFYVKREGDSFWLGFSTPGSIHRTRISKTLYQALMQEAAANRAARVRA